jgi:hypothetical protein
VPAVKGEFGHGGDKRRARRERSYQTPLAQHRTDDDARAEIGDIADLGDTSTLADPSVVEHLVANRANQ